MSLPTVSSPRNTDFHIKLKLCEPWRRGTEGYVMDFRDVFDVDVSFNRGEGGALTFSTYKTDEAAKLLQRDDRPAERGGGIREYSVVVLLWDWRRRRYIEPDNARFIVSQWDEDILDGTNKITYSCVQEVEVLKKAVLMRAQNDKALNDAYDAAEKAYEDAEREYDRLMAEGVRLANRIKQDRFGHERGDILLGYAGTRWIASRRAKSLRWGTLTADTNDNRLKIYQPSKKRWLRLSMKGTKTDWERERLVEVSEGVRRWRRRMEQRRDAFARATWAARNTSRDGTRFFHNLTPARVIHRAWIEASVRDARAPYAVYPNPEYWQMPHGGPLRYTCKGLWRDWSPYKDSKGRPWPRTTTRGNWEFPLGISIYDMMQDFRERGEIDWVQRGSTISMVPTGGLEVDQTNRVALRIDDGTLEATERGSRMEHFSVGFVVMGSGYAHDFRVGSGAPFMGTPWGAWEGSISESDAHTKSAARSLTEKTRREAMFREVVDAQRRMTVNPNGAVPGIDFQPHHWVSVWDHHGAQSRRIVDQIILSWDGEAAVEASITFGTRRERRATQFARTIAKTTGGTDHIQGHIPVEARLTPPEFPSAALHSPTITSLSVALRPNPQTGHHAVTLRAQWATENLPEPENLSDEDGSNEAPDDGSDE